MIGSGKTSLAKILARQFKAKGGKVAVYDPYLDTWAADRRFRSLESLRSYMARQYDLLVVIDESGWKLNRWLADDHWFATQSRHRGHNVIFVAQTYNQIAPIVRQQCSVVWLLPQRWKSVLAVAEDFAVPYPLPDLPDCPGQFAGWRIEAASPKSRLQTFQFCRLAASVDISKPILYDPQI